MMELPQFVISERQLQNQQSVDRSDQPSSRCFQNQIAQLNFLQVFLTLYLNPSHSMHLVKFQLVLLSHEMADELINFQEHQLQKLILQHMMQNVFQELLLGRQHCGICQPCIDLDIFQFFHLTKIEFVVILCE